MILLVYILLFGMALSCRTIPVKRQVYIVQFLIVCLVLIAGTRDWHSWADTDAYLLNFNKYTPGLFDFTFSDKPYGFDEWGFYFLGVVVKTITGNQIVYLTFVAGLSMLILGTNLKKYCLLPLLGLLVYVSRFYLGREMVQIRAGISYAVLIFAIQYMTQRDWKRYFLWVFIAYLLHRTALLGVGLYFLTLLKFKKKHVVLLLALAFIIGGFFSDAMKNYITDTVSDITEDTTYISGMEVARAKGLANPLIYFQTLVLLIYTFGEKRLVKLNKNYYAIRTAYLLSTFILISFSMFLGLCSRTASIYATLEILILPELVYAVDKSLRAVAMGVICIGLGAIFYLNYS